VYPFDEPEEDVEDEDDVVDLEELSMAASWAFIYAPSFRIIKDGLIGYYVSQSGDEKKRMRMYRGYVPLSTVVRRCWNRSLGLAQRRRNIRAPLLVAHMPGIVNSCILSIRLPRQRELGEPYK